MPLVVWKNTSFAAVCIAVFLAWAAFNGVQYFATLTFVHSYYIFNMSDTKKYSNSLLLPHRFILFLVLCREL